MMDEAIESLLATASAQALPDAEPKKRKGEWQPGVVWDGTSGVITTDGMPAEQAPDWSAVLRVWGLDPEKFDVVEPVLFNVWGDTSGVLNRQWKGKVVYKQSPSSVDLDELIRDIKRHKKKVAKLVGDGAFVVVLSDWQIGKPDGDGTTGTVKRILKGIDDVEARIDDLRKLGRPIGELIVLWTGDSIEGCVGHYAQQTFGVEFDRRDQVKIARRLLRDALVRWSRLFDSVRVVAVAGNHGENRNSSGKSYTTLNDNDDIAIVEQVAEILLANPEAFGHVMFAIPRDSLSLTLDVAGWVLGITHGHAAKSSGGTEQKLKRWLESQALGRSPIGNSDVLVSGHYHHLRIADWGGAVWLQAPALDGGSTWWEQMSGERSQAGILTFCMYPDKRVADLELLF